MWMGEKNSMTNHENNTFFYVFSKSPIIVKDKSKYESKENN